MCKYHGQISWSDSCRQKTRPTSRLEHWSLLTETRGLEHSLCLSSLCSVEPQRAGFTSSLSASIVKQHLYLQTHVMSELSPFWPPTAVWGGAYWHQLDSPRWTGRGRRRLQREKTPRQSTTFPPNKPADASKTPPCFDFDSKVQLTVPGTVHLCLVHACWAPPSATSRREEGERNIREWF